MTEQSERTDTSHEESSVEYECPEESQTYNPDSSAAHTTLERDPSTLANIRIRWNLKGLDVSDGPNVRIDTDLIKRRMRAAELTDELE